MSTARKALVATGGWTALLVAGGWAAVRLGWITDDGTVSTGLVIGWFVGACTGLVVFVILTGRGRRLITEHLQTVADLPATNVPDTLLIGSRHPGRLVGVAVAAAVVGLVVLPLTSSSIIGWVVPEATGVAALIHIVLNGPSAVPVSAAHLSAASIRMPLLGIEVPWTSVTEVHVADAFHLAATVGGPVHPTGTQPDRWAKRAMATHRPGTVLRILTDRPELAFQVATRHLTSTRDGTTVTNSREE